MDNDYCQECKSLTPLVFDHRSGNTICSECGLVLESHSIGETAKWQNFLEHDNNSHDLTRVGSSTSLPFPDGHLGTSIQMASSPNSASSSGFASSHWQNKHGMKTENPLDHHFKLIGDMADKLGLVDKIKNHAKFLYKKAEDKKLCGRFRSSKAVMAASVYLACQEEGLPRTLKEILTVTSGISMKEVHKSIDCLKKQLEVGKTIIKAKDLAKRFCSNLGLSHRTMKAVQETANKSDEYDVRRNSTSILAAAIYMVTQLSEERLSLREIAQATEVAEATIRKTYKELYSHASCLVPSWYAKEEDIRKILLIP